VPVVYSLFDDVSLRFQKSSDKRKDRKILKNKPQGDKK
jgi:hypothetical protein